MNSDGWISIEYTYLTTNYSLVCRNLYLRLNKSFGSNSMSNGTTGRTCTQRSMAVRLTDSWTISQDGVARWSVQNQRLKVIRSDSSYIIEKATSLPPKIAPLPSIRKMGTRGKRWPCRRGSSSYLKSSGPPHDLCPWGYRARTSISMTPGMPPYGRTGQGGVLEQVSH